MTLKQVLFVAALVAARSFQLAYAGDAGIPIIGGSEVGAGNAIARTTVALVIRSDSNAETALCTGSIIASDLIVTAAHCLKDHPSDVSIVFGTQISDQSLKNVIHASHFLIHPSYRMNQSNPDQNDIAVISFRGGLPSTYHPNRLLVDSRLLTRGEDVILAGYGVDNAESHAGAGTLREVQVSIADENYGKSEILLAQNDGRGACHGDSGGPAFLMEEGNLYLWGVTSRAYPSNAPDDCAHESVYTTILGQADFLKSAIQKLRHAS